MPITATSHRIIPFIVSLSFFMEAIDSTVINTAIPAMSRSLMVEPIDLKVSLISYLLSLAIFIPISGWLADKYSTKKVFITAVVIFTLSSFWCGLAASVMELSIARFMQGLGGALGLPVGRLIIVRYFVRQNLIVMMSYVATVGSLGIMLGPVVGGLITSYFSWHWIFWVNIPVGFLTIFLSARYLPNTQPKPVPPLDKLGFVLFSLTLCGITFGLSRLSESTADITTSLTVFLMAIFCFMAYLFHSRFQPHPIVKTSLFGYRTFQISAIGNLISRLGFGGIPFLVPLLLQISLGFSPELSGLLMAPTALGILIAKPCALPLLRQFGYKQTLMSNTFLAGLAIWMFMLISYGASIYLIGFLTFFYGFTLSLQYSLMNSLAYADIPQEHLSAATSIIGTLQQLAQSFGVAVSALFIRIFSYIFAGPLTPLLFHYTFLAIGILTILSAFVFIHLKSGDGQQMIDA